MILRAFFGRKRHVRNDKRKCCKTAQGSYHRRGKPKEPHTDLPVPCGRDQSVALLIWVGDGESYKRALTFLEECDRLTLRSLVRKSAERHVEVTVDHAKTLFLRALKKLNAPPAPATDLDPSVFAIPPTKCG